MDSKAFLDEAVTPGEYVLRYSDQVVHKTEELFAALGIPVNAVELEGVLAFHGYVVLYDDMVDQVIGTEGTGLAYPFQIDELYALADELQAGDG